MSSNPTPAQKKNNFTLSTETENVQQSIQKKYIFFDRNQLDIYRKES